MLHYIKHLKVGIILYFLFLIFCYCFSLLSYWNFGKYWWLQLFCSWMPCLRRSHSQCKIRWKDQSHKTISIGLYYLVDLTKTFNGLILIELEQLIVLIKLSGSLLWYGWFFVRLIFSMNSITLYGGRLDSRHGVYKWVIYAYQ